MPSQNRNRLTVTHDDAWIFRHAHTLYKIGKCLLCLAKIKSS